MEHRKDPLVIGATGGSGTRVFSKIARDAGIHMGWKVDDQEDALAFSSFYTAHLPAYLESGGDPRLERDFADAVSQHLQLLEAPDQPWGVKNPRSMLLLPFWHERYPDLRFVHVVRNGLDIAYSPNQNQPEKYAAIAGIDAELPVPVRAIRFWQWANLRVADYGEQRLGERYVRIRHEDLCDAPEATIARLLGFLGRDGDDEALRAGVAEVSRPPTLERWREHPPEEIGGLASDGREALERFGYWTSELDEAVGQAGSVRHRLRTGLRRVARSGT